MLRNTLVIRKVITRVVSEASETAYCDLPTVVKEAQSSLEVVMDILLFLRNKQRGKYLKFYALFPLHTCDSDVCSFNEVRG